MRWVAESTVKGPADIERLLGVGLDAEPFMRLRAYERALARAPHLQADLRLAYKIAEDSHYRAAFEKYGTIESIAQAGFFDDGLEPGRLLELMNPNWLVTPLDKVLQQIELLKKKPPASAPRVVLLSTGCFAPIHEGHLAMMSAAWIRLAQEGYAVLGGFFSSSHDAYVATKGSDAASLNAGVRLRALNHALNAHDWLMADPWESLYVPASINFTDVARRLGMYLNRHITNHPPITVAYVFGSDNAPFARAFTAEGLAVCVDRPGYEAGLAQITEDPLLTRSGRILITDPKLAGQFTPKISSTAVRSGAHPVLTAIARELLEHQVDEVSARSEGSSVSVREDKGSARDARAALRRTYLIRNDVRWGAKQWEEVCDRQLLSEACETFTAGLTRAIAEAFERSSALAYPALIEPLLMPISVQKAAALELAERYRLINNDVVTMDLDLGSGLSRLFALSAAQFTPGELVERPENIGSFARLAALPAGHYVLLDDDIATGTTMRAIRALLSPSVSIIEEVALSKIAFDRHFPSREYAFWDVVDGRDFLMGTRAGGLVVRLFNEQIARAPYFAPYVSLSSRANIPPSQERALSLAILQLNREFFAAVGKDLNLRQSAPAFQNLMAAAGFAPDTSMLAICDWHRAKLLG